MVGWRVNAQKRGTWCHPMRFHWGAAVQQGGYSGNRLPIWSNTLHTSHTQEAIVCAKCKSNFQEHGKKKVCADLWKPWNIVSASFNWFLFWDRFSCCSGVNAWWPWHVLPISCLPKLTMEFSKCFPAYLLRVFVYFDSILFLLWVAKTAWGPSYQI